MDLYANMGTFTPFLLERETLLRKGSIAELADVRLGQKQNLASKRHVCVALKSGHGCV